MAAGSSRSTDPVDDRGNDRTGVDADRGVYGISVAAELVGTGVQSLRLYEVRGLLEPARTDGGTRRYSPKDITRLRRIADLLADGLNLAGIAMVLDLEHENAQLKAERDDPLTRRSGRSQKSPSQPSSRDHSRSRRFGG